MLANILQRPFFYDVAIEDNIIYFPIMNFNGICKGNLTNDEVEILDIFPEIPTYIGCACKRINKYKNNLLCVPYDSKKDFVLYDLDKFEFFKISNNSETKLMSSLYEYNGCLYFICLETTKIFKIDLKSHTMQRVSSDEYIINDPQIRGIDRVGKLLYIPIHRKKVLFVFNFCTEQITQYKFPPNIISTIQTLCQDAGKVWITTEDKKIYWWKLDEDRAYEVASFPDNIKLFYYENIWFGKSFVDKNILWLFPTFTDSILKYNILTNEFEKLEIEGEEESAEEIDNELRVGRKMAIKYSIVQKHDNKVFFLSSKTRLLYELNLEDNTIFKHSLKVKNNFKNFIYPPAEGGIMFEKTYAEGLNCLIKYQTSDEKTTTKKGVGELIYKFLNSTIVK